MVEEEKSIIKLNRTISRCLGASLFLAGIFFSLSSAQAASLYLGPNSGSYKVGDSFTVSVYVSAEESINAVGGDLNFPADKLEIKSLSTSGSIVNFWVQNPNHGSGIVHFEGVILSPGFKGNGGKIISVSFKTKAAGPAPLSLSNASILADDGKGTNVISGVGRAAFEIGLTQIGPGPEESSSPPDTAGAPLAAKISSPTHPEPTAWYNNNDPRFEWALPKGATDINVLVDENASTNPGASSDGRASHYNFKDIDDGEWYFHLRLKNAAGWGGVSHFKFQIDTAKPDKFVISPLAEGDGPKATAKFLFLAEDSGSGIDRYEVSIDGGEAKAWQDSGDHIYETPILPAGTYSLEAKAFDRAGNYLSSSASFKIEALSEPEITDWPKELSTKEKLEIKGQSAYPDSRLLIWLQKEGGEVASYEVLSDAKGNFIFSATESLSIGKYTLWAEIQSEACPISQMSRKVNFEVVPPKAVKAGLAAVNVMAIFVPLLALIILLAFLLWYSWRKFKNLRQNVKREVRREEADLYRDFFQLRQGLLKQMKVLDRAGISRDLTEEEKKIMRQTKKLLKETRDL